MTRMAQPGSVEGKISPAEFLFHWGENTYSQTHKPTFEKNNKLNILQIFLKSEIHAEPSVSTCVDYYQAER